MIQPRTLAQSLIFAFCLHGRAKVAWKILEYSPCGWGSLVSMAAFPRATISLTLSSIATFIGFFTGKGLGG
jgi:hypothetical protein